jgi:hypothetical protein
MLFGGLSFPLESHRSRVTLLIPACFATPSVDSGAMNLGCIVYLSALSSPNRIRKSSTRNAAEKAVQIDRKPTPSKNLLADHAQERDRRIAKEKLRSELRSGIYTGRHVHATVLPPWNKFQRGTLSTLTPFARGASTTTPVRSSVLWVLEILADPASCPQA